MTDIADRGRANFERLMATEIAAAHASMDAREAEMDKYGYGGPPSPNAEAGVVGLDLAAAEREADAHRGAEIFLGTAALSYAAACGDLSAGERAELHALRRFRDGVVALRAELADAVTPRALAIETIDSLFTVSYPPVSP